MQSSNKQLPGLSYMSTERCGLKDTVGWPIRLFIFKPVQIKKWTLTKNKLLVFFDEVFELRWRLSGHRVFWGLQSFQSKKWSSVNITNLLLLFVSDYQCSLGFIWNENPGRTNQTGRKLLATASWRHARSVESSVTILIFRTYSALMITDFFKTESKLCL